LLEPLAVGPVTLQNRMVMGAMHTRLETMDGRASGWRRSSGRALKGK
jgi:2,4-dienoyl-CoA reductase-like NADH-dependent reductase (Old Yellow Enzyme family)